MGGPGAGKTVFALQCLVNAVRRQRARGIFVAFEESPRQIVANAATFDWGLPACRPKKLFFLDAHLSPEVVKSGEFDLAGMLAMLKAKKEEIGAQWIVFDGIDVLLDAAAGPGRGNARDLPHPRLAGGQRVDRHRHGQDRGQATSEAVNYGFMQFMVDCVVRLERRLEHRVVAAPPADHEISRLGLRGGRVSGELRALRDGGGRPRTAEIGAQGFERAASRPASRGSTRCWAAACSAAAAR